MTDIIELNGMDEVEQSALKQFDPLTAEGVELGNKASGLSVTNDEELAAANITKKSINAYVKKVKDMRLAITRPIDGVKDVLIARERELLKPAEDGKEALANNILAYDQEVARLRRIEEERIDKIAASVDYLYRPGMTRGQLKTGGEAAKALMAKLGDDANIPKVKLAFINLSNKFSERGRDLDIEDARAKKQKLDSDQAKLDEEKRELEARKQRIEAEKAQVEIDKAAAKAERERPKSNIVESTEFEIVDAGAVPRALCSPDPVKIRAWIKATPNEVPIAGVRIFKTQKVR